MHVITRPFRRMNFAARLIYLAGLLALIALVSMMVMFGTMLAVGVATVSLALFLVSGPFVLSGLWRAQPARPTRRPVVRRRRY